MVDRLNRALVSDVSKFLSALEVAVVDTGLFVVSSLDLIRTKHICYGINNKKKKMLIFNYGYCLCDRHIAQWI